MKSKKIIFSMMFVGILLQASYSHAAFLDLSLVPSSGSVNGGLFSRTVLSGQGSGNLNPFVRIQENGSEKGYNTDGTLEFDTKPGTWTHSIKLSEIPYVNISGTYYRQFLLDAAESSGNSILLKKMEIYLLNGPSISGYPANFPAGNLKYTLLDANYDSILLDNVGGSGEANMYAYIPDSYFTGSNEYLYLYSEFDQTSGAFEEWGTGEGPLKPAHAPEPASILLFGMGAVGAALRKRFSR